MKTELVTVEYGGTIPTVQYGNRQVKLTAVVEVQEGDDTAQVVKQTIDLLAEQYEQEEKNIKAQYQTAR